MSGMRGRGGRAGRKEYIEACAEKFAEFCRKRCLKDCESVYDIKDGCGNAKSEEDMVRDAIVVQENGKLMAEVVRTEACQTCRACAFGKKERVLVPVDAARYAPGDRVEIELKGGSVAKASLAAYGVPVVLMVFGLLMGGVLSLPEWGQAASGILGCGLGFVGVGLYDRKIAKTGKYAPVIRPAGESGAQRCGK